MSKESAKEFALAALEDDELRERTSKIEPEKVVAIAKELGYDFTAEELAGVMNEDMELSADDLEAVAGGNSRTQYNEAYRQRYLKKNLGNTDANQKAMQFYCHGDTNGPKHEWNITRETTWFFWLWNQEYDQYKCRLCGYTKKISR